MKSGIERIELVWIKKDFWIIVICLGASFILKKLELYLKTPQVKMHA